MKVEIGLIRAARVAAEVGMTAHRAATPLATEAAASGPSAAPAPEAGFRAAAGTFHAPYTQGANSEAGPGLAGIGQLRLPGLYHWPSEIESILICIYCTHFALLKYSARYICSLDRLIIKLFFPRVLCVIISYKNIPKNL
jgi:hypothetical protein